MTREQLGNIKIQIKQRDFAAASDEWLNGFQAGTQAALDAVAAAAFDGLPNVTKEQGMAMRTGLATPSDQ